MAVEGVDSEPVTRNGDISATGIYFETDQDVGEIGSIQSLRVVSPDSSRRIRVLAYVVRTVTLASVNADRTTGVALEFMPENQQAVADLYEFVGHLLALRSKEGDARIAPRDVDAQIGASGAQVRQLGVRTLVLETSWHILPGQPVRMDIVAPGFTQRVRLEGQAVRVVSVADPSGTPRYSVEVEVQRETGRPLRLSSSTMPAVNPEDKSAAPSDPPPPPMDDLLSALLLPQPNEARERNHMSGQLSRIRLPSLLSLFEMERVTGKLELKRGEERAALFLAEGRVVDAEPLGPFETARARVGRVLAWQEGTFAFYLQPVARPDRVGTTTTALLLDLARVVDEETHNET